MKLIVVPVLFLAFLAGTARPVANAALPAPSCAKNGPLPTGTTAANTALVHVDEYDGQGNYITRANSDVGGFNLRRIGRGGKRIPLDTDAKPDCFVLVKLPYFGRRAPMLCIVVRKNYQAQLDPQHPDPMHPVACPAARFDQEDSGLYVYYFSVKEVA